MPARTFVYVQAEDSSIYSFDTDGGAVKSLAKSLDDFLTRVVFGPEAASFAGREWVKELRRVGLVPPGEP